MVAVVAEAYLLGVSTRRVEGLVQAMGINGISRSQVSELAKSLDEMVEEFRNRPLDSEHYTYLWVDALYHRVREGGRVVNVVIRLIGAMLTEQNDEWTVARRYLSVESLNEAQRTSAPAAPAPELAAAS